MNPVPSREEAQRQQLAIIEWLGLSPDEVSDLSWTVTEELPVRTLCGTPAKLPEPEAVIEFRTPAEVRPRRWTHGSSGMDQPNRWTLIVRASELDEVLA